MELEAHFRQGETDECCKTLSYPKPDSTSVTELLKTFQHDSNQFLTQCIDGSECLPAEDEDEMDSESEEDETSLPERPNKLIKMA